LPPPPQGGGKTQKKEGNTTNGGCVFFFLFVFWVLFESFGFKFCSPRVKPCFWRKKKSPKNPQAKKKKSSFFFCAKCKTQPKTTLGREPIPKTTQKKRKIEHPPKIKKTRQLGFLKGCFCAQLFSKKKTPARQAPGLFPNFRPRPRGAPPEKARGWLPLRNASRFMFP